MVNARLLTRANAVWCLLACPRRSDVQLIAARNRAASALAGTRIEGRPTRVPGRWPRPSFGVTVTERLRASTACLRLLYNPPYRPQYVAVYTGFGGG